MVQYFKASWNGFKRYLPLLENLVQRDIKVKYRRSKLGIVWSILNPLLMMLVMWLVFSTIFNMREFSTTQIVRGTGQPPSFMVYLLSGQLMFNFFSEATNLAMDSVLNSASLIKKVYIPKYIFPLEKAMFALVNAMFSLIALVLVFIFTRSPISPTVLLFPVVMLLLFVFALGVGLILSAATVFFRDIKHFYGVILLALNYLTPIFYAEELFSNNEQLGPFMYYVLRMNPLYWFVGIFRRVVVYGYMPTTMQWVACSGFAVGALILGLFIFKKTQDKFILHV